MGTGVSKSPTTRRPTEPRNNTTIDQNQISIELGQPAQRQTPVRENYENLKQALHNFTSNENINVAESLDWINQAEKDLGELKRKLGLKDSTGDGSTDDHEKQKIKKLREDLRKTQEEKQQLLNQISEVAGARLKNNNPAIADLSDDNRPAKIAEKFSELYDNEWTNVVECLKDKKFNTERESEEKVETGIIEFLLSIVTGSFHWCKEKASNQLVMFTKTLLFSDTVTEEPVYENVSTQQSAESARIPAEIQKRCKEILKKYTSKHLELYEEHFRTERLLGIFDKKQYKKFSGIKGNPLFVEYINKCVTLSWFMCVQDPPVEMTWDKQNTIQYRAYTRSGKFVEFVVWPALLLNKDGPLLYKGVAQFLKDRVKSLQPKRDQEKTAENSFV